MTKEKVKRVREEAIKEFAEKLKGKYHKYYPTVNGFVLNSTNAVKFEDIDNLVKEMTGDSKNENSQIH